MVGTIFQKSKIELQKWFFAISIILNAKNRISARQLAAQIEVNKNTSWLILVRIKKALATQREFLTKIVGDLPKF